MSNEEVEVQGRQPVGATASALLCACLRWPRGDTERALIARLAGEVDDWAFVQRLILRHRVVGLASDGLLTAESVLPPEIRGWCRAQMEETAFKELAAAADAAAIIGQFAAQGVRARLLKGPAVSILAYGRLGLRTNRDLDLLVAPEERPVAAAVVEANGWMRVGPAQDASPFLLQQWLRSHKDFAYTKPDGRMLELHWGLFDNRGLLNKLDRSTSKRAQWGPFAFETLPATENLLYLCVHGAEHAWSRLKWLADVGAMLRQLDPDALTDLIAESRACRVYPAVAQAIILCHCHLGLPLPRALERRLVRDPRVGVIVRIAERALFAGGAFELEEQRWGSTLKNISHYLMASGWRFLMAEFWFDLTDLSAAHLPESYRRFGPFARVVALAARAKPA